MYTIQRIQLIVAGFFISNSNLVYSQRDDTFNETASGRDIAEAVLRRLADSTIFQNDHLFLLRLAYIETEFGEITNYTGQNGGIWNVDEPFFLKTQEDSLSAEHLSIKTHFGIDWQETRWSDLRKPMFSGLCAALYFTTVDDPIPFQISQQAEHWQKWYRPSASVQKFINASNSQALSSRPRWCQTKIHMCLSLDSSSNVNKDDQNNFAKAKEFMQKSIRGLFDHVCQLGDYAKLGMLVYNDTTMDVFPLNNSFDSFWYMYDLAGQTPYLEGGIRTDLAVSRAVEMFQDIQSGDGIPRVLFVFTTKNSDQGSNLVGAVRNAAANGVQIVSIGIGSGIDVDELKLIAMNNSKNVFVIDNFDSLLDFTAKFSNFVCEIPQILTPNTIIEDNMCQSNQRRMYELVIPEEGLTVTVIPRQNWANGYWSYSDRMTTDYVHDGKFEGPTYFPKANNEKIFITIINPSIVVSRYTLKVELGDTISTTTVTPSSTNSEITTLLPTCPTTELPSFLDNPKFTKTIYQSSLLTWPVEGTTARLGIQASVLDEAPLSFKLITQFDILNLTSGLEKDIVFTASVAEGAFVGPNNVMVLEVEAFVSANEIRKSNAVILIAFPQRRLPADHLIEEA